MDDLPRATPGGTWLILELLRNSKTPWICALVMGLEFFMLLPSTGRCRCGAAIWSAAAIMTDAGPRMVVSPSDEWYEAQTDGSLERAMATASVMRLNRHSGEFFGFVAARGITVRYTPTPGSGYETPLAERAFREELADALEQSEFSPGSDLTERLRSGNFVSSTLDVPRIVATFFVLGPPVTLALSIPMAIGHAKRLRRIRTEGLCAACGYELAGLTICPECGEAIAPSADAPAAAQEIVPGAG